MPSTEAPVLILGAGINGAALARELALNGVPVVVVDQGDLAAGATAYSSRLIHGGLRYLEHGDFSLVRESLAERTRLLQLAPDFVQPLRLHIPVGQRTGGWLSSARRFLGRPTRPSVRGLWLVRAGLWFYDRFARDPDLPRHSVARVHQPGVPPVAGRRFRWLCSYSDAQMVAPERFVVALLRDAAAAAAQRGSRFEFWPYHRPRTNRRAVELVPVAGEEASLVLEPAAVFNATGAWIDQTLQRLELSSPRLIGGTKGSHFVTAQPKLVEALHGDGLYAEADDGRPFFILPFGDSQVLVGTTDLPYDGDPAAAVATDAELNYLVEAVNDVLPAVALRREDIHLHYAGVRPLPAVTAQATAAITRQHSLAPLADAPWPCWSLVGGKLTTCRSFAEEAARMWAKLAGVSLEVTSRDRPLSEAAQVPRRDRWPDWTNPATIDHIVRHEWPTTLDDLVERRLLAHFDPALSLDDLENLAGRMRAQGRPLPSDAANQTAATLLRRYGRRVQGYK